jgi:tetratricopeptide (TPR) repeat protein
MTAVAQDVARIRRDAMAAVDSRQWGRAIVLLRKYVGLQPADSNAWTRLAESCERGGDRAGALDALRVAAEAWEKVGLLPQSIAHWSKVARLSPNDGWAEHDRATDLQAGLDELLGSVNLPAFVEGPRRLRSRKNVETAAGGVGPPERTRLPWRHHARHAEALLMASLLL